MKLNSEISVGWSILYACIVASLSGGNSGENARQETIDEYISSKYSECNHYRSIENFPDSNDERVARLNSGVQKIIK
jgi:hypothetical protein